MTKELLQKFINAQGTGTGPTRYRHFRELAKVGDLPLKKLGNGRFSISNETIKAYQELTSEEKNDLLIKYRRQTMSLVRLSSYGLAGIEEIISKIDLKTNL